MRCVIENLSSGFQIMSDTNRAVQPQKMARGLKFQIQEEEGLYYLFREKRGADQLPCYRASDMPFIFAYAKSRFSHNAAQISRD